MHIGGLSTPEIIIILVVVVLLFGVGRISKIAGELGSGIRAFKTGLNSEEKTDSAPENTDQPKETLK